MILFLIILISSHQVFRNRNFTNQSLQA